jgi:predicted glycoside hydrolase/deacetylase ChbG (UPF0249 family)
MKSLVINADDLGMCESTNSAIADAHRRGILTSASLMATGVAFDHAYEHVVRANPRLGIGLHVCLTNGRALCPPSEIPLLVDDQGRFRNGFLSLYRLTLTRPQAVLTQVEREVSAQFERLLSHGISIDHVDGHRHVHMIPRIFPVVSCLALRYGCAAIRVAHEPFVPSRALLRPLGLPRLMANLPKKLLLSALARRNRPVAGPLAMSHRTIGILGSGRMDRLAVLDAIANDFDGATEIITHPGLYSANSRAELLALLDPHVRDQLHAHGRSPRRFSEIGSVT